MFFIKPSKIVVDVFTQRKEIADFFPITKAINHAPDWWKQTKKTYKSDFFEQATIKSCDGLTSYLSEGFILPLWSDLAVKIEDGDYQWQFSDEKTFANIHNSQQWNTYANPNEFGHLKLQSPYRLKQKQDFNWLLINPTWHQPLDNWFNVSNGIIEFKNRHELNVNIMLNVKNNKTKIIEAGTPILHLIPLTQKIIELKHHIVADYEFKKMDFENISFRGAYRKKLELLNKKSKCPFHF